MERSLVGKTVTDRRTTRDMRMTRETRLTTETLHIAAFRRSSPIPDETDYHYHGTRSLPRLVLRPLQRVGADE